LAFVPRPSQLALVASVLAVFAVYALAVLASPGRLAAESQLWPGHYTVLLDVTAAAAGDGTAALARAAATLQARWQIVSRFTSHEEVTAFSMLERVLIVDLPKRLHGDDPRFDPYLKALPSLFAAGRHEVVFVRSTQSPLAFWLATCIALAGLGVRHSVVELHLAQNAVALLLLVTAVGWGRRVAPLAWSHLVLLAAPFLGVVIAGNVAAAALGVGLYSLGLWLPRVVVAASFWRRPRPAAITLAIVAVIGTLAAFALRLVDQSLLVAWGAQLALGLLLVGMPGQRTRTAYVSMMTSRGRAAVRVLSTRWLLAASRTLRIPYATWRCVALAASRIIVVARRLVATGTFAWPGRLLPALIFGALAALLPLLAGLSGAGRTLVAMPAAPGAAASGRVAAAAPVSLAGLQDVAAKPALLPTLAGAVSHAAYQYAIGYGGRYGLPRSGDMVELPRFELRDDGTVRAWSQRLLTFDDAWLGELIRTADDASVVALLARTGGRAPVLGPTTGRVIAPRRAWRTALAAALIVFLTLTLTRSFWRANTPGLPRHLVLGWRDGKLRAMTRPALSGRGT
jgi:hypothetical protein